MTNDHDQTATGADAVASYVAAVREALADLPAAERDELLEDLTAHLTEVAAEEGAALWDRLGTPEAYAAELRAAADPRLDGDRLPGTGFWLGDRWAGAQERLRHLDAKAGPLLGYERASEFGRLLVPAWWVLRGYLAAMVVVTILDRGGNIGLLPRLGGSTLAGLVILAGFVAGSVWLAHRTPRLSHLPRRAVAAGSVVVVLAGLAGALGIDDRMRAWYQPEYVYSDYDPYGHIVDIYPVDEQGRLLTGVRLLDQHGNPIDLGWTSCDDENYDNDRRAGEDYDEWYYDEYGERIVSYPRCPRERPWWNLMRPEPTPTPAPTVAPGPEPTLAPMGTPQPDQ